MNLATVLLCRSSVSIAIFLACALCASAQTAPISGWAWSDTVGWISLNCTNTSSCGTVQYGLEKASDGTVSGYAWSENIGWISAEVADLTGCPVGTCSAYVSSSGLATGWLRAISAQSGWDGWISLRDTGYGVQQTADGLTGWAWGDAVLGWVLFSADLPCALDAGPYCDSNALKYKDAHCTVTTLVADCGASGCSTAQNQCVIPTPPKSVLPNQALFIVTPTVVQYGKSASISWDVANADSCTVSGNGNTWTGVSGLFVTNPIQDGGATYSLHCSGAGGVLDGKTRITNPPRVREI
jgi:hypothetical protein